MFCWLGLHGRQTQNSLGAGEIKIDGVSATKSTNTSFRGIKVGFKISSRSPALFLPRGRRGLDVLSKVPLQDRANPLAASQTFYSKWD